MGKFAHKNNPQHKAGRMDDRIIGAICKAKQHICIHLFIEISIQIKMSLIFSLWNGYTYAAHLEFGSNFE